MVNETGIEEYLTCFRIKKGASAEETLNRFFIHLAGNRANSVRGPLASEFLSGSAVALMGLGRIKDPFLLYQNMANAFERRGQCIYTGTVRRAFVRLQNDSLRQKKKNELEYFLLQLKNHRTQGVLSSRLEPSFLKKLLQSFDGDVSSLDVLFGAARALVQNPATSQAECKALLNYFSPLPILGDSIQAGAAQGLVERERGRMDSLSGLLSHPNDRVRFIAAEGIARRAPPAGIFRLMESPDSSVSAGAVKGFVSRKDVPLTRLQSFLDFPHPRVQLAAARAIASRDGTSSLVQKLLASKNPYLRMGAFEGNLFFTTPLKRISGKRILRKNRMAALTRHLVK
ncbi:MAG: HEAT repeat domain-containing protein [Candidatus Diapherotrites archaeon]|nr:HEAT repeat domain-containing protein [Candidatus Diapherotrites archaeon]